MPAFVYRPSSTQTSTPAVAGQARGGAQSSGSNGDRLDQLGEQSGEQSAFGALVDESPSRADYSHLPLNSRGRFTQAALAAAGDMRGVDDILTQGRHDEPITRAQAAAVVGRVLGWSESLAGQPALFGDVPLSHWAAAWVYRAREEGVFAGFGDGSFGPERELDAGGAAVVLQRVGSSGSRVPFDREAALAQETGPTRDEGDNLAVQERLYTSLAQYEGGRPDLVHYDSDRVNLGKGSWTGGHIPQLMDLYVQVATENALTDALYAPFGGRGAYDALRARFVRNGINTTLTTAEEEAFRTIGRDPVLATAQDRKGAQDVMRYINQIGNFDQPWPFTAGDGSISELAVVVLCHAAHQAGSSRGVVAHVMGRFGGSPEAVRRTVDERGFLQGVADRIVAMVQERYRRGVRNRYDSLFRTYGLTNRYFLGSAPPATVMRGQVVDRDGNVVGGGMVRLVDGDGGEHTCTTNAAGFFECARGIQAGTYTVSAPGGPEVSVTVEAGRIGWAQVVVDDAQAARDAVQAPDGNDVAWSDVLGGAPLREGARGPGVTALQDRLNKAGFWLVVDGSFGPATLKAVTQFQRQWGLSTDGVVGVGTANKLDQVLGGNGNGPASLGTTTTHTVRSGESLWQIAADRLGDGRRYAEIARLNNLANPNRLAIGQVLRLPAGASAAGV